MKERERESRDTLLIGRATTATGLRIQSGTLPVFAHRLPLPDWIAFAVADAEDHAARGSGGCAPAGCSGQTPRWESHQKHTHPHTHTHPFNGPLSGTTRVSQYQKGKPIWILLKQETVSGSGISWHMQVCTSLQTDNHTSIPPLCFLQAGCPNPFCVMVKAIS